MLGAITLLLLFQLIGEVIARGLALPVPGPVIGMGLLLCTLVVRGRVGEDLQRTAGTLLQNLSLLFVPAGTGVMLYFQRVTDEWLPLVLSVLGSTLLAIAVTALIAQALHRRFGGAEE
ncbi:MAG: CidA/LrgA family protein [Zoogloea sp.]|nr:CidA/LrgA family protein [Zoogloea sp.]